MKIENLEVFNIDGAIRGMRNPLDSWAKGDTKDGVIGPNDMKLATKLIKAGPEHRKFLRQMFVSLDITAPLYIYKEFDTYKINTTANSCSTMHTISKYPITLESFEYDPVTIDSFVLDNLIPYLEDLRNEYIYYKTLSEDTEDYEKSVDYYSTAKMKWKELIRWLPESWLQKRTWTANYEVLLNMVHQRKRHKLTEWNYITDFLLAKVPYLKEFYEAAYGKN